MWLVPLIASSITALALYFSDRDRAKYLVLFLWGGSIMVLVDWLWGYLTEGEFIPREAIENPVNSSLLGLLMTFIAILMWLLFITIKKIHRK